MMYCIIIIFPKENSWGNYYSIYNIFQALIVTWTRIFMPFVASSEAKTFATVFTTVSLLLGMNCHVIIQVTLLPKPSATDLYIKTTMFDWNYYKTYLIVGRFSALMASFICTYYYLQQYLHDKYRLLLSRWYGARFRVVSSHTYKHLTTQ